MAKRSGAGSIRPKRGERANGGRRVAEAWEMRAYDPETGQRISRTLSAATAKEFDAVVTKEGTISERSANKALASFTASVQAGASPVTSATITFDALAREWLDRRTKRGDLTEATVDHYEWAIGHLVGEIGSRKVRGLSSPLDIEDLYSTLARRLSPKSVKHIAGVLFQILKYAMRRGYVRVNAAAEVEERPAVNERPVDAPEDEDVQRFLSVAKERDFACYAHLCVSIASGGRRGEVLGLRKQDVLLDTRQVWLRLAVRKRRLPRRDGNGKAVVGGSRVEWGERMKTESGRRRVHVGELATSVLRELIRGLDDRARAIGLDEYPKEGFLFSPDELGERPYHPDSINARFRKISQQAGVRINPHELRHYAATKAAPELMERDMMGRFGWRTNTMIVRYADYRAARDAEAGAAMDAALKLSDQDPLDSGVR